MSTDAVNENDGGLADAAALAKAALAKVAALEKQLGNGSADATAAVSAANDAAATKVVATSAEPMTEATAKKILAKFEGKRGRRPAEFYEAQKLLGTSSAATESAADASTAASASTDKEPMSEAKAKKILAQFEGKRGRRPAEFYEAQKLLGVDGAKPKAKKDVKIIVVDVSPEPKEPMSENKAKKILAQFEGKRGRRPAEFYEAQKVLGVTGDAPAAPKAKASPKKAAKAETAEPMSENKAKKILAQFEGKRGRRPAEYYEALKVLGTSGDAPKKAAKATPAKKQKAGDTGELSLAEAKKILAQYAGKRGRRPEIFYKAEKLVNG